MRRSAIQRSRVTPRVAFDLSACVWDSNPKLYGSIPHAGTTTGWVKKDAAPNMGRPTRVAVLERCRHLPEHRVGPELSRSGPWQPASLAQVHVAHAPTWNPSRTRGEPPELGTSDDLRATSWVRLAEAVKYRLAEIYPVGLAERVVEPSGTVRKKPLPVRLRS